MPIAEAAARRNNFNCGLFFLAFRAADSVVTLLFVRLTAAGTSQSSYFSFFLNMFNCFS